MLSLKAMKAVDKLPLEKEEDFEDSPSVVDSDVSSTISVTSATGSTATPKRLPLQWEFKGLTLWMEFEEFNEDLTHAIDFLSSMYGTEKIPVPHATAIYGMEHLSQEEAVNRLHKIPDLVLGGNGWPMMDKPVAIKQDIAQEGLPGQVCSIAWAELTLKTNPDHEKALDALHNLFDVERNTENGPWTPHISLAYDNPEESVLELSDLVCYALKMPSLLQNSRRIKAISLWSTVGKLGDWECLGRVNLL